METIDQFMWGFQPDFRRAVESKAEAALSTIGLPVEVRAVLVGFATVDARQQHRVCIEPENGSLNPGHLSGVPDRAEALYAASPESRAIYIDNPQLDSQRRAALRSGFRARALVEAIEASGLFDGLTFFASESAPIGDYEVHTCLGVPTVDLEGLPALRGWSLHQGVIAECLRRADTALYLPDPGQVGTFTDRPENIVRAAARRLAYATVCTVGGWPADLFHAVNEFTSLSYERAAAGGHLTVVDSQKVDDRVRVRFRQPVSLNDSKIIRKLLELSDESTSVITNGQEAHGLGSREPASDTAEVSIRGHAEWDLSVGNKALMRLVYGKAKLPSPPLARHKIDETAQHVFGSVDMDCIWPIIEAARHSGHGMMLVVADSPEEEASRLGGQAVPIDPEHLSPDDIARLGRVDGAVLLGPDGRCHAFGVILDGAATGHGDPARGSRFNSAIRYQKKVSDALLIVISDDGPVVVVPDRRPKVHRDLIEDAVQAFCEACEADPVDNEEVWRRHREVKKLAFYLSEDQCRRVNDAYQNEIRRRAEAGEWAEVSPALLRPDPEMDDSFFH